MGDEVPISRQTILVSASVPSAGGVASAMHGFVVGTAHGETLRLAPGHYLATSGANPAEPHWVPFEIEAGGETSVSLALD